MTDLHSPEDVAQGEHLTEEQRGEQAWGDWWSSDRLDAAGWAAIFFWGALVVLATYTSFRDDLDWWNGWGVFFVGAGVIVLFEAMARVMMPEYRSKWGWTLFWGSAFLALGLGELVSPAWYALPLAVGAAFVMTGVFTNKR